MGRLAARGSVGTGNGKTNNRSEQNIDNALYKRKAWLGQATCPSSATQDSFKLGITRETSGRQWSTVEHLPFTHLPPYTLVPFYTHYPVPDG